MYKEFSFIEFEKEAVKHISKMDKTTKMRIKQAIDKLPAGDVKKLQGFIDDYRLRVGDLIDDADMDTIFRLLVRFVPEDKPLPDEVEAIRKVNKSITESGTVSYDKITDSGLVRVRFSISRHELEKFMYFL